jgi:hypothetical protein
MAVSDVIWDAFVKQRAPLLVYAVPALCALFILVWGRFGPRSQKPAPMPPGVIPPKAKKAIDYLTAARHRERRLLAGVAALIAAIGAGLLIFWKLRP